MQPTLIMHACHLVVLTTYRRHIPFRQIEELSLSPLTDAGGRWAVVADLAGDETARLRTFAPDDEAEALVCLRSFANTIFGGAGQGQPVPAQAKSSTPVASVEGPCLRTVSSWGTRYMRRARVQGLYLAQAAAGEGGRWEVVAELPQRHTVSLQSFAPDAQAAAEAGADQWAAQLFAPDVQAAS